LAVAVKVCTRAKAESKRWQDDGFLSPATTRNSIGAFCAMACMEIIPASDVTKTDALSALRVLFMLSSLCC
jgi:hypothetical protein